MQFYQYWIILFVILFVVISIINIAKMIVYISKNKSEELEKNEELKKNIRNLLVSIGLLSVTAIIYILLIFYHVN